MKSWFTKITESLTEGIYANYHCGRIASFLLSICLGFYGCFAHLSSFLRYSRFYCQARLRRKKVVLVGIPNLMCKRFSEKLISCLRNDLQIALAIVSLKPELDNDVIFSLEFQGLPTFSYGILPLMPCDLFLTGKAFLSWHYPLFGMKVHMFHSMASAHMMYPEYAFDGFDGFFAMGPHHEKELMHIALKRRKKTVRIFQAGSEVIDRMMILPKTHQFHNEKRSALYAPSWGKQSSFIYFGEDIIRELLRAGLRVDFRPHRGLWIDERERVGRLLFSLKGETDFQMENPENADLIRDSYDFMVTDWSGAAFEFAFAYEKPVLFIDCPQKVFNPRWADYNLGRGVEYDYREKLGLVVAGPAQIRAGVDELLSAPSQWQAQIRRTRDELLFHAGESDKYSYRAVRVLAGLQSGQTAVP